VGIQPVAQSLNRPSLKMTLSEVTSLPCEEEEEEEEEAEEEEILVY
jgi:hypothetical protein